MHPDVSELAKALVREMRESERPNYRVNDTRLGIGVGGISMPPVSFVITQT
jgi:hypothetical protein